MASLLHQPKY